MFERYTERARRALFFARYEVSQLGSVTIAPEHLLLGLIRDGGGMTGLILARFGVSREDIRRELESRLVFREKVATSVEIPFSEQGKRVLKFATQEADALSHKHIGPEHLLLGVLREGGSGAAAVLMENGMQLQPVRDEIQRLLNDASAPIELDTATNFAEGLGIEPIGAPERLRNIDWTLEFHDHAYWLHREGEVPEGPYCAPCWDTERLLVRMDRDARGEVRCGRCGR